MTVLAYGTWRTNADLIADVAKLGYLKGSVLDATYGKGKFWKKWSPDILIANDLNPNKGVFHFDFTKLPKLWDNSFDAVVLDPPYRLNGTPDQDYDESYGIDLPKKWQERHGLIRHGISECLRVTKKGGYFLLKCQDQVCSGNVRWQTYEFWSTAVVYDGVLVDSFHMVRKERKQPKGRKQVHARRNASTLLVFRKK